MSRLNASFAMATAINAGFSDAAREAAMKRRAYREKRYAAAFSSRPTTPITA